jgi:hypothetical protein
LDRDCRRTGEFDRPLDEKGRDMMPPFGGSSAGETPTLADALWVSANGWAVGARLGGR